MAMKQEIIEAIRTSQERVFTTFSSLSAGQLATRVHDDEGDQWTAKQVLAHLAGRAQSYELIVKMAQPGVAPPQLGGFDIDEWNRRLVDARFDKGVPELLAEFKQVHDDLVKQVETMPEETLRSELPMPQGAVRLGDQILSSGAIHSINHAEVVEQVLGLT